MNDLIRDGDAEGELDPIELRDWYDSLDDVAKLSGPSRVSGLLRQLQIRAQRSGIELPVTSTTPYVNTIPVEAQPPYPGDQPLERRIKSILRWNAMAMVVRGNKVSPGIGGHISTYASSATLSEVGFNHFFRGRDHACGGDHVYFQGHAAPGNYARAYLEGRLTEQHLANFRRELAPGGGLSSYPHPWLMPNFWEFPTVSMGLGPLMAIYRARFMRYLEHRGLVPPTDAKVWAFLGDGETDEPEALGAITLAPRENLDNLIFVVNCNLQRLDGPVRGNGKIIQELEAAFRGSGWNVLKVVWGSDWDPLLARDLDGHLVRRMGDALDGDFQKYAVEGGAHIREHFFGTHPALREMVSHLTDDQLWKMRRGGHDPRKVHAAFAAAVAHRGGPTCILVKTIKGYGLGEAGEGRNVTHQQKKLNEKELLQFRDRFDIPVSDAAVRDVPFYRPPDDSPEIQYLRARRAALGGFVPERRVTRVDFGPPAPDHFAEFLPGTGEREVSTTMAFVKLLSGLLRDKQVGKRVVPIVPDEARTFGMESLFRQIGIYSSLGQLYEPVDAKSLLYYREARDGQLLEEGITEAGCMSSFIAAGTSHATHGPAMIPIFLFYSMFGFQRIGDLIWAAADSRARGFMIGCTAGRTTLNGEGLQHEDGNSHVLALPVPNLMAYDPAFAYEMSVIVKDGMRRMYEREEDIFYYLTAYNENYLHPAMPEGATEGILRGLYRCRAGAVAKPRAHAQLVGSGPVVNAALGAQRLLAERYGVAADVWSATSYKSLREDGLACERWNMLHPEAPARVPWVTQCLGRTPGVVVAASDFMKVLPDTIARWVGRPFHTLGTEGFGRSESRDALRHHFEINEKWIALAALATLAREGALPRAEVTQAIRDLGLDPEKPDPLTA